MIEFYTGVPGSGKTYKAVSYAYDCFLDEKSKNYKKFNQFYTNINELDFDSFNSDLEEVAYPLDFDLLLKSLFKLHKMFLEKKTDSELMVLADELNLSHSLFLIDECHNYFNSNNEVLIWWLSYHRHLHQDILFMTQNLSLVFKKYLSFSEFFYKAVPSSMRLRAVS